MSAEAWQITWFTAGVAALSTLLILPVGVPLAWLLARRDWPGKSVVETLVALPLVMPPVATGLLLLKLLGRRGPLGGWLERTFGWEIVFTWRGVVVATAVMSFPLLVRTARVAFEGVNPRLEQVARTLGAGPWRVFFTITLPLAARGLVAGVDQAGGLVAQQGTVGIHHAAWGNVAFGNDPARATEGFHDPLSPCFST